MTKAEEYRKRIADVKSQLKEPLSNEGREKLLKKKSALKDLADVEDWLQGSRDKS